MKSNEIISKINHIDKEIEQTSKKLDELKSLKKELYENVILKGISFVPYDLAYTIRYLVRLKEGKEYIREEGTCYVDDKEKQYLILRRLSSSNNPNIYLNQPDNIKIFFDRYTISQTLSLDCPSLTFKHLLEKYNVKDGKWVGSINSSEFEYHPYVKDFITYLSDLQIENGGRLLSRKEMFIAAASFVGTSKFIDTNNKDKNGNYILKIK